MALAKVCRSFIISLSDLFYYFICGELLVRITTYKLNLDIISEDNNEKFLI